jgi:hypothetical protein
MDVLEETRLGPGSIVGTVDQTGYDPNLNMSDYISLVNEQLTGAELQGQPHVA